MKDHSLLTHVPMTVDESRSAQTRWVNKPVLESKLLDDMETEGTWQHHGVGEMSLTGERFIDGTHSLRLTSKTKMKVDISPTDHEHYGRPFGEAVVRRVFTGEDFTSFNRLSFWVYPTLPGFKVISMYAVLHNDGEIKIPDSYEREGLHFFLLKPDQWNHVVWEIASLPREYVTGIDFIYRMQGNEPGAADTVCFDIDKLELQKVEADHFEGWDVAPGHISFSHTGYQTGSAKSAIGSTLQAKEFTLVNSDQNKIVLRKAIENLKSPLGEYQLIDFTEIDEEGTYYIQAGDIKTGTFRIDNTVWRGTIWKTLNFFFCERCGFEVPGIHDICHRDWVCENEDQKIIINGGWHDAGDLSQGIWNTTEATYAMFHLAEKVKSTDVELYERLLDEGRWGLDWIMKTRFGDGNRSVWATMDFWTDGILGTLDDVSFQARNIPFANFDTASAEAVAARVLKETDPILSSYALKAAIEDWDFAVSTLSDPGYKETFRHFPAVQLQGTGALASIELFRMTGEQKYADKAFEQAKIIMDCQQKTSTSWDIPLSGFFYTDPSKQTILRYFHLSQSQAPVVALSELLQEFPDHRDWMDWYTTVALYSDYLLKITEYTKPYTMFPCSIYKVDESDQPTFKEQVMSGIRLSDDYYLRLFPVWYVFRGNNSLLLSDAKALSSLTRVRKNTELLNLSQKQLEWVVGRNPFSQSMMYGEGYDYAPQYTAMSGNMTGSLPVGIQTSREKDIPYWPVNNCYNYKEVWVQPSARWLWLMSDLSGMARVSGSITPGTDRTLTFTHDKTGKTTKLDIDRRSTTFEAWLPQGRYSVSYDGMERVVTLLPGEDYALDLGHFYSFKVETETINDKEINLIIESFGEGCLNLEIRSKHVSFENTHLLVDSSHTKVIIKGKVTEKSEKWYTVIIPENSHADMIEIHG